MLPLTHYIEFPNLGWKLNIDDTIHLFGSLSIKWYGLLIAIGFLLAVIYGIRRAPEFDINPDHIIDVALPTVIVAFIGARLYYVFFSAHTAEYLADPISILKVWEGGLGIYGGIITAFLFGPLMCKWRKVNILAMFDLTGLGFLIGQSIGRWGNFFNQEAFGGNTNLPWAMTGDIIAAGYNGSGYDTSLPVHPTFLYESLWCALGFVLLHVLSKRAYKFKGQIFCGYMVWYGFGRFLIEGLRADSLMTGTMKTSQLVAVIAVVGGIALYAVLRRREDALPLALETEHPTTDTEEKTETQPNEEEPEDGTEN